MPKNKRREIGNVARGSRRDKIWNTWRVLQTKCKCFVWFCVDVVLSWLATQWLFLISMSWDPPRHPRFQRRHLCCQRDKAHPTGAVVFIVLAIEDMSCSPDSDSYRGLTSNRGGGRRTTLADGTWHPGYRGRGAIAGCYRGQLWGSGRGAIAGCHCSVLWLGGMVMINFRGVDAVPLLGAIAGWCHCSVLWLGHFFYIDHTNIVFCYLGSMPV